MRAVLITTKHRGVFFGYAEDTSGTTVKLENARCAIRWGTNGGFLELADTGPTSKSLIGSKAPRLELRDVTSVADVSETAEKAWLAA